jgi:UDP-2,3-diacylglucosamine pyrophosphatase LpxH
MRRIYVISDLHLGGEYPTLAGDSRGFRICTRPEAIVQFVEAVIAKSREAETELVINGDMVDFLAEEGADGWSAFTEDPSEALAKFKAIVDRDKCVFDALNRFLDGGGALRILLGNHDIELSLPAVRNALHVALGLKGSHDFQFLYDGEAYHVGDVLIEHGNRYDAWNQVDYDSLRRIRSLQSRGQRVTRKYRFDPPAGSAMVASVINPIKKDYRFIDLLKPEEAAAIPLLLALEPGARSHLRKAAILKYSTRKHGLAEEALPKFGGDVSSDTGDGSFYGGEAAGPVSGVSDQGDKRRQPDYFEMAVRETLGKDTDEFLGAIPREDDDEVDGIPGGDVASIGKFSRRLGLARLIAARDIPEIEKRIPPLHQALRVLQNTKVFDQNTETAVEYLDAAKALAYGRFRHVVFGHTHLPKKVDLGGGRYYLNSGTWADVLHFPVKLLKGRSDEVLKRLMVFAYKMVEGDFSELVLEDRSYVMIELKETGSAARLELASFKDGPLI